MRDKPFATDGCRNGRESGHDHGPPLSRQAYRVRIHHGGTEGTENSGE